MKDDALTLAGTRGPGRSEEIEDGREYAGESFWRRALRRFYSNSAAVISLVVLVAAALIALCAPLLTHYNPTSFPLNSMVFNQPPGPHHWLGTDGVGRDFYTRILYGMRGPLAVAYVGAVLCTLLGATLGIAAGLLGGWVDEILMRITEAIFVIPGLLLILLGLALFGNVLNGPFGPVGRYIMIVLFLATDSWPIIMRLAREETMRLREEPFVEAAYVVGATERSIMTRHLFPNMLGILMVQGGLLIPGFLFATGALGFLGLGAQAPLPDLGQLINDGANVMQINAVEVIVPVVVMTVLILASTFLGDGLRDAFAVRD